MSKRCAVRLPTPGTSTSASRSSSARQRRKRAGECTDRIASASFGPDAGRADQRLERVALVARREAEEDHRVVAHVQVREQERVARPASSVGDRAERHVARGSRRRRLRRALRPPSCARARVPRTEPITRADPICCEQRARGRGGSTRARARRPRRAASGTSRKPSRRVTIACTPALSARPSPVTASFTSFGLYCATGTPARAAATSARPLACPTDIAVRALTWNSTRSTATRRRPQLLDERGELVGEDQRAVRAAGRSARCGSRRTRSARSAPATRGSTTP